MVGGRLLMFVVLILWAFKEFSRIFLQLGRVKGENEGKEGGFIDGSFKHFSSIALRMEKSQKPTTRSRKVN